MQPNTRTRPEYKGKIYVKNIIKIHIGFEKNHSASTALVRVESPGSIYG
jgi:hypothetical protein